MDIRSARISSIPQKIWTLINQIDTLNGQWIGGAQLNPQALGRLKRSVLITSTGSSTRIEGVKLSDDDVEKFMRGLAMQKFTDRDKQEVKGYYELLEKVFDFWKNIQFNENSVKHLHQELLKYTTKDERHRGDYKKIENSVEMFDENGKSLGVIFEPIPAYLTPKQTQELIEWTVAALAKKDSHPLLVIGNFLVEFLAIHPFQDGNGRLSRILTNLLMIKAGYSYMPYVSHEKIIENSKSEYYIALRKSQLTLKSEKHQDITAWLEYFLLIILTQSQQAIDLLSHENLEKLLSPKQLKVWQYIETQDEISISSIVKNTGIAHPTASQALVVLLRLKKIERIGQGRTTRYRKK